MAEVESALAALHKEAWGRVVASLLRVVPDLDLAEESAQEAFALALVRWPETGLPDRPRAWLVGTGRHLALDRLRRRRIEGKYEAELAYVEDATRAVADPSEAALELEDERLRLFFTCCHPALPEDARIALTLRTLAGLTTEEIARAFLVPVVTMQQRLVRAKAKLAADRVPYEVPGERELPERLPAVLATIYLVFNEGYSASAGDSLVRAALCQEAISLGRTLAALVEGDGGVLGLLALMLLTDARRAARTDASGELVLLGDQDRSRWDRAMIDEGRALVRRALRAPALSRYALEAAIQAVHSEAERAADTRWAEIEGLYAVLLRLAPTPVVALNAGVAHALAGDLEGGLARIEPLEEALAEYAPFHAARADLLRRLGRGGEARAAYERAASLAGTEPERRFLSGRAAAIGAVPDAP
jgi:RNA polymerase sigma-70 factor, ECF subfamily